jgi:hypothetical protein
MVMMRISKALNDFIAEDSRILKDPAPLWVFLNLLIVLLISKYGLTVLIIEVFLT